MPDQNLILIDTLCPHYEIEISFFEDLISHGLLTIITIENKRFINKDDIGDLEKIVRLRHELNINIEGIDVILNLLQKEKELQEELIYLRNRLSLYEV